MTPALRRCTWNRAGFCAPAPSEKSLCQLDFGLADGRRSSLSFGPLHSPDHLIWISARRTFDIYAPIMQRRKIRASAAQEGLEMTRATVTILLACALSTASLATSASDQLSTSATTHDVHEAHSSGRDTTVARPDGERWPTDEPLRIGMSRIQAAVEQPSTSSPLSRERSLALARTIEQNVTYIIEHCKLPPKADAALHMLIARVLAAARQLQEDSSSDAALAQILSTLHDYRDAFDHSPAASSHRH